MTPILVHFIDLNRFIRPFDRQAIGQPLRLNTMTPLEQVAVISSQFSRNLAGRVTWHDAPQQQDDFTTIETDVAQNGLAEDIKHPATRATAIAHDGGSGPVVRRLLRWQGMSLGTTQPCWMQDLGQKIITFLLIHQIFNGKWEHCFSPPTSHFNSSMFDSP
jgi:hypothetical protein